MSNNLQTGMDNLAKAKDWDSVQRHTRRAIESFKFCGEEAWLSLLETYQLSIESFEHTGQYQQCGIFSDEAGDIAVKLAEKATKAENKVEAVEFYNKSIQFFTRSAKYFRLSNNIDKNAAILLKGSESYLKIGDKDNAIKLLEHSCSIYEDDFKLINAEKFLNQAFGVLMQLDEYQRAIQWLQYQIKILSNRKDVYANTIYNNFTEELVILLYLEKYKAAHIRLQQIIQHDEYSFMSCGQYLAIRDLIEACDNIDNVDAIQECRKKNVILKYLDRNVAMLIPKLKQNMHATSKKSVNDDDNNDEDDEEKTKGPVDSDDFANSLL